MSRLAKPFLGRWRIHHMDVWDQDYLDLVEPAFMRFEADGLGEFVFGTVTGQLDCRFTKTDVDFSWQGQSDMDEACGRGKATLTSDGTLEGHLYIHLSDESGFKARKK